MREINSVLNLVISLVHKETIYLKHVTAQSTAIEGIVVVELFMQIISSLALNHKL